jgi:hypothetical protein
MINDQPADAEMPAHGPLAALTGAAAQMGLLGGQQFKSLRRMREEQFSAAESALHRRQLHWKARLRSAPGPLTPSVEGGPSSFADIALDLNERHF